MSAEPPVSAVSGVIRNSSPSRREEIDSLIAAGKVGVARTLLAELLREDTGAGTPAFVAARFERLRDALPLKRCRLAILRSFVVEPVIPQARAMAFVRGVDLDIHIGDFNAYMQEVLDPASAVYAFEPDVVVLAVLTRDASPRLWDQFSDLDAAEVEEEVNRVKNSYRTFVRAFRERSNAQLVIHSLETPPSPAAGILDAQNPCGQIASIRAVNEAISQAAREARDVYILDYEALAARRGTEIWIDRRTWETARLPIRGDELRHLAAEWLRFLHPLTGVTCKVLAVDLDGTLWDGVVGEDGVDGVSIEGLGGSPFRAVQRAVLDLHRRGVILAICSKNNEDEALAALEKHSEFLLRPQHFAAHRINWDSKAESLRDLAAQLNVGLDSVAFLDDNPVERSLVRAQAPEITVIDLPDDPHAFADAVRAMPIFERLGLTDEDRKRSQHYAEQQQRAALQQTSESLEDFYHSLEMSIEIRRLTQSTIARAAQLTQKTNQFNLTTRRYTELNLEKLLDAGAHIFTTRVKDRFGDNGIVGVTIAMEVEDAWSIDTMLLSCRVIGRTIETAILATIAEEAEASGATTLRGSYIPTSKNVPARDFYATHGFAEVATSDGASTWELGLAERSLSCPPWIVLDDEVRHP
jgi:FkbH-like protein